MEAQLERLPELLAAHLQLALLALVIGLSISLPLGVWVSRRPARGGPVLAAAGIIQTIPSLALLAFMVPVIGIIGVYTQAWFGFAPSAIGFGPALVALTLYSILPIVQNTVTGVAQVNPALVEAAQGVGMTPRQQLLQVELPEAAPVIVAGIRTATVWVIGIATLSTPIGAPSLGNFIFQGLQTRNYASVTMGCLASAVLAVVLDRVILQLQKGFESRSRARVALGVAVLSGVALFAVGAWAKALVLDDGREKVVIGSKPFTEAYIMSQVFGQQIEKQTDLQVEQKSSLGSAVVFDALKNGDVHLYLDFSGTVWTNVLNRTDIPEGRDSILRELKPILQKEYGIEMLGSLGYENLYAFAMRRDQTKDLGIKTLSDLAEHDHNLEMAADYDFFGRTEWASVERIYGMEFGKRRSMDPGLMYQALKQKEVDVISAYTTDGRIDAFDLEVLEDDKDAIPPYHAIILLNADYARSHPEVVEALKPLLNRFTAAQVRKLNYAVDEGGKTPSEVARGVLNP